MCCIHRVDADDETYSIDLRNIRKKIKLSIVLVMGVFMAAMMAGNVGCDEWQQRRDDDDFIKNNLFKY